MANRLSKEKAAAIAAEYHTNGFKKVMALLSVGYSVNYANNGGLKLFDNDSVKTAIAKIEALAVTETGYTVAQCEKEYELARKLAMTEKQPAAASTAITGKARLYGMDKDANIGEKTVIIIAPRAPKVIVSKEIDTKGA